MSPALPPSIASTTSWTERSIPVAGFEKEQYVVADSVVRLRIYRANCCERGAPLVLHFHGGAFVAGGLDQGVTVATALAEAGAVVASIEYPLAPEHPFPAALHAGNVALQWLQQQRVKLAGKATRLFVAGEEAGGNLAAGLALKARDVGSAKLAGQILLSPMLDPRMATRSARAAECGPVGCRWADGWQRYLGSAEQAAHPYAAALGSSRLNLLPPALVITAADDPMHDESMLYADRLRDAGVTVHSHVFAAPTGFPCALAEPATSGSSRDAPWRTNLRDRFHLFFAETLGFAPAANLITT
ncbi:MAG: alpha/beta hydrolase [Rhodospirillales bacterium]|nr:alpha/beta hydrolase [Rhodospirillales bacterium]